MQCYIRRDECTVEGNKDDLFLLPSRVTLAGSSTELRLLANFLLEAAKQIETLGEAFGHVHWIDSPHQAGDSFDVVVTR